MAQYTPGPWKIASSGDDKRILISGPQSWYPGRTFCWVDHDDVDHEEMEANARLIAAAPDLLAALEMVCDSGCPLADVITEKMLRAIAQARGEK